nr:PREDICTED: endophilin-B2-like [Paralichthys olivaceus]
MCLCLDQLQSGWESWDVATDPAASEQRKLLSEEVDKAEHELRVAQTEFDRQAEVTRLLLEGISSTHLNHQRCLQDFAEAQATYYAQCHHHMQDLQRELHRCESTPRM